MVELLIRRMGIEYLDLGCIPQSKMERILHCHKCSEQQKSLMDTFLKNRVHVAIIGLKKRH